MTPQEKARQLRPLIEKAATSLPDEDALEAVELFKAWYSGIAYLAGERVRYEGKLYRCEQAHTSQVGWEPPVTPALWTEVAEPGEIPVWKQPTGAQDAYMAGDKVHYPAKEDPVYISTLDYNTYPPDIYGWEVVT
ncbi:MAG: hypothetical protein J6Y20_03635 [Lachnospiraceae bacterium]|nr:hypothetical protein [Lachnospiraceae bacterium]